MSMFVVGRGERRRRVRDGLARAVAWALPRRVVYWAAVRVSACVLEDPALPIGPIEIALARWSKGAEPKAAEHRFETGPLGLDEACERCGLTPAMAWAVPCDPL